MNINMRYFILAWEYHAKDRKTIGFSLCPWGWDYPWVSCYIFGLYICFRAQFRLHRKHNRCEGVFTIVSIKPNQSVEIVGSGDCGHEH